MMTCVLPLAFTIALLLARSLSPASVTAFTGKQAATWVRLRHEVSVSYQVQACLTTGAKFRTTARQVCSKTRGAVTGVGEEGGVHACKRRAAISRESRRNGSWVNGPRAGNFPGIVTCLGGGGVEVPKIQRVSLPKPSQKCNINS